MDDMCKKITIKIPVQQINQTSISAFENLFKTNIGKQSLRFVIYDAERK